MRLTRWRAVWRASPAKRWIGLKLSRRGQICVSIRSASEAILSMTAAIFGMATAWRPVIGFWCGRMATSARLSRAAKVRLLPITWHAWVLPFDRAHWTRLGCSKDDLAGAGSDRLMDAVVAWGSETAIRSRIQARLDAGANHVCIQPLRLDGQSVPDDEALAARAAQAAVGQGRSRAEPTVVIPAARMIDVPRPSTVPAITASGRSSRHRLSGTVPRPQSSKSFNTESTENQEGPRSSERVWRFARRPVEHRAKRHTVLLGGPSWFSVFSVLKNLLVCLGSASRIRGRRISTSDANMHASQGICVRGRLRRDRARANRTRVNDFGGWYNLPNSRDPWFVGEDAGRRTPGGRALRAFEPVLVCKGN